MVGTDRYPPSSTGGGRGITRTNVYLVSLVWLFAVVMAALSAILQGQAQLDLLLLNYLPPMLTSIGWSLGLVWLAGRPAGAPFVLRLGLSVFAVLAVAAIQTLTDILYNRVLALTLVPAWRDWALDISTDRVAFVAILYTWTFAFCQLLVWAMRTSDTARLNAARAAAFEAATLRAEADVLRLQLNPHFLFNTLNGIAALTVSGRTAQAERTINLLADFLRSSIALPPSGMAPLADEIATAEAYLRIEQERFGPRMTVLVDAPPETGSIPIPNFILQPLVENAVKHGVSPTRAPVVVSVVASLDQGGLSVRVGNAAEGASGRSSPPGAGRRLQGFGVGLANTRRRLAIVYGNAASLETRSIGDGFEAHLRIPRPFDSGEGPSS